MSPVIAGVVAAVGTWLIYRVDARVAERLHRPSGFRWGQIGTRLAGLARARHQRRAEDDGRHHARPDRQRALDRHLSDPVLGEGRRCALAIAAGTYLGGWRIIRTLGKGLVEISPAAGHGGRGRLGRGHPGVEPPRLRALDHPRRHRIDPRQRRSASPARTVRWRVAGRMVVAWLITLPMAALVGAVMWWIGDLTGGGLAGALVIVVILVVASGLMYVRSRRHPVTADNVNDEWEDPSAVLAPSEPVAA